MNGILDTEGGAGEDFSHHPRIWLNGEIRDSRRCGLSPWIHGLHYATFILAGIGLWKGVDGCYRGFRWQDHALRFFNNLKAIGIPADKYSPEILVEALAEVGRRNLPHLKEAEDLYLRLFGCQSSEALGVGSRSGTLVAIVSRDLTEYLNLKNRAGVSVLYPGHLFRRRHPSHGFSYAKASGNYDRASLFKGVVASKFQAVEVIAEAWDGKELSETTGSNIFIVKDGVVHTPRLESWCLRGITRDTVIRILRSLDIKVEENAPVLPELLFAAEEVFLTGTWSGVVPVDQIFYDPACPEPWAEIYLENGGADFPSWLEDNFQPQPLRVPFSGKPGSITARVREIYWAIVRHNSQAIPPNMGVPPSWHTLVAQDR